MIKHINEFSKEVCAQIGYYVYRLIDPRDGNTFYVGKGKNNRLFKHVSGALDDYNSEDYLTEDKKEDEDIDSKINTIREIHNAGLEVIHVIQRWGLTEHEALLVESAIIDIYGLHHLSNKARGFDKDHGVCNADELEQRLNCPYFEDGPDKPPYIIIKVKNWWINERGSRYGATRSAWKMAKWRANPDVYPYVLSVTDGIVREVYKVKNWQKADGRGTRLEFVGEKAPKEIEDLFINKRIPEYYSKKGMASPVLFSKR